MSLKRRALRLLIAAAILYLGYLSVLFAIQRRAIYPGWSFEFDPPPDPPAGVERWTLDLEHGNVHAFFAPAERASSPGVVLLHGNLQAAEHLFGKMRVYREHGFSVLIPEYRGYMGAAGAPTQDDITADIVTFTERFAAHVQVDPERIVYHGVSLGGAVAASAARERAPRALILQSTFTSVADMARGTFAPRFIIRDPYDTEAFLAHSEVPVLLLHGRDDSVVPVGHAHANAAAASQAELVLLPGDHGLPADADSARIYWSKLFGFLVEAGFRRDE